MKYLKIGIGRKYGIAGATRFPIKLFVIKTRVSYVATNCVKARRAIIWLAGGGALAKPSGRNPTSKPRPEGANLV